MSGHLKQQQENSTIDHKRFQFLELLVIWEGSIAAAAIAQHFEISQQLAGHVISKYKKMMAVAREQKNSGADKFITENRSFNNVSLISNKGSTKKMVMALLSSQLLLLVCDQNAKDKGNKVNFFGKKCSLPKGPGHFYYLTKCKLTYGFCILKEDYK